MGSNVFHIGVTTDQAGEYQVQLRDAVDIRVLVGQVADARSKAKAEQVHQPEHMVGEASRVGVVLLDPQVGLVIQQSIQHMGGIARWR